MKDHPKRIRDFLSERSNMRGLCPEQITGANDNHLNVSDLRALLADLDAMRGALEKIAKADNSESGCYYTNRANISIARAALKGAEA